MKKKIYIFLDVDGVLNNINFWKKIILNMVFQQEHIQ